MRREIFDNFVREEVLDAFLRRIVARNRRFPLYRSHLVLPIASFSYVVLDYAVSSTETFLRFEQRNEFTNETMQCARANAVGEILSSPRSMLKRRLSRIDGVLQKFGEQEKSSNASSIRE